MIDDDIRDFYFLTISNNIFYWWYYNFSLNNLSNDEITIDTTDHSFIYSTEINSEFKGDTLIKNKKLSKSFNPDSHEEIEFWEESYKSIFIIDSWEKSRILLHILE